MILSRVRFGAGGGSRRRRVPGTRGLREVLVGGGAVSVSAFALAAVRVDVFAADLPAGLSPEDLDRVRPPAGFGF
ncbi:MAG: hypothetical protein ABR600_08690 [Actinomycetota bacterium]